MADKKRAVTQEKLVALCKNRGFIFPGSEIYGGLANTWDYGPLGVELKNNIKKAWWKKFVQENVYNTGLDCAILMNPRTWKASGHIGGFSDPLMDCKNCKTRHRADNLIEDYCKKHKLDVKVEAMDNDAMEAFIKEHGVVCPVCGTEHSSLSGCPTCALNWARGRRPAETRREKEKKPPWEK